MVVKLTKAKKFRVSHPILKNDLFKSLAKLKLSKKIAVAVSGGPDSLALTILLNEYATQNNIELNALSIDHGLRKSSSSELRWLSSELKKKKIRHKILKWKNPKPRSNILTEARNKRYALLIKECERINAKYLFTGHHFDDQVENILLRMIRGSGIKGLGSLQEKFKFNKHKTIICRPLLKYTKKSLISFLANEDQKYILDPTNYNDSFDRSRVRKVTQHLINEGLDDLRLKKTIKNLKDANNSINYLLNTSIRKFLSVNDNGLFSVSLRTFKSLPEEIKYRSISKILKLAGNGKYLPRSKNIQNLLEYTEKKNQKKFTIAGCIVEIRENKMIILPEVSRSLFEQKIKAQNFIWREIYKVSMKTNYAKGLVLRYLGSDGKDMLPKKYKDKLKLLKHEHASSYLSIWKQKQLVAVPSIGFSDKKVKTINKYELTDIYELLEEARV